MKRFLASCAALTLALGITGVAAAAKPLSETTILDEHFIDTELCPGFDVMTDITGFVRFTQFFDREGNVVKEINGFGIRIKYSANGNTVRVVDVGVDLVKVQDDGSVTVAVTGNLHLLTGPGQGVIGGEAGRLFLHISPTGEVTVISDHGIRAGDPIPGVCELLAA